jgi:hypothetical protein
MEEKIMEGYATIFILISIWEVPSGVFIAKPAILTRSSMSKAVMDLVTEHKWKRLF